MSVTLRSIDTRIAGRLKEDREFRKEWYRAELEQGVPELFRELREFRRLTQAELADMVGMRQSAVSRFEKSSEPNWKFETLLRIADALDAQLVVGLEKSEDVIKRYEIEESKSQRGDSLLEISQRAAKQHNQNISHKGGIDETAWHSRYNRHVSVHDWKLAREAQFAKGGIQSGRALSI